MGRKSHVEFARLALSTERTTGIERTVFCRLWDLRPALVHAVASRLRTTRISNTMRVGLAWVHYSEFASLIDGIMSQLSLVSLMPE